MSDNTSQLENMMAQPQKVEVDDKTVEQHSLQDVIAMDRYISSKKAQQNHRLGVRIARMMSGGGAV